MMNRYGARGSPWRTPVLMLKLVFTPSGVNTTAEVYYVCMALMIFSGVPYPWRISTDCLYIYIYMPRDI